MKNSKIYKRLFEHNHCEYSDITCRITSNTSLIIAFTTFIVYFVILLRNILIGLKYEPFDIERLLFVSLFNFAAYFLHKKGYKILAKELIVIPLLFFLVYYPLFLSLLTLDVNLLYAIFIVLLGTISQLIFDYEKERSYYIVSLIILLLSLYYTDIIYDYYNPQISVSKVLGNDLFIVKLGYIVVFIIINYIIYSVLNKYRDSLKKEKKYITEIEEKNEVLDKNNIELKEYKEEIQLQNEELQTYLEEIRSQRDRIEDKNNEIIKSITYARKIQKSLIPQSKILYSYFNDFFIYNKPKDILSGDFYWTTVYEDKVIVAVADCTGHGVPAALLSVLGISMLNEITLKYEGLTAGEILDQLKIGVVTALSHSHNEDKSKDGMDISLIIYDKENKLVEFAGAYNPFVVVRNKEILSIDGDRMPIGIFEIDKKFKTHQFDIEENDMIYLFSDGFVDQFGGNDNKKIKRRRFKDLLISTSTIPLPVQKEQINMFFKKWKGENEQVDDVLIIGLKV